ncbi:enoyl-CoA hydratase/isomerase family protein [Saitoella complicata NRRL Y-17804]|nr:enoyl-CoA hydratase/isomerase family protein [Saitoella complicata NRRL Y-17804]ODQ54927.1 enoyl-CoA hydratase/isomerase family protein [Saitoella complicata NRRL Y-17804]
MTDKATYDYEFLRTSFPVPSVLHIELNRAPLNAFHEPFWRELGACVDKASTDPDVRAIVLSSVQRIFTAGLDIKAATEILSPSSSDPAARALHLRTHILDFQHAISSLSRTPKPIIAALHSTTIGLGIDIASACDIRLCSSDFSGCVKEVDIGLAADIGSLQRLPYIVGSDSWVREICFTARPFGAEEALQQGFVSRVFLGKEECVRAAIELATKVGEKSPVAVQGTKHLLNWGRGKTVEEGLEYTAVWNAGMLQSGDIGRAVKATLMKNKAIFPKL